MVNLVRENVTGKPVTFSQFKLTDVLTVAATGRLSHLH